MTGRVSCHKLQASAQEQTFQRHLSNPYCLILKLDFFAAFRYSQQPVGVSYFCMSFPYVHLNRVLKGSHQSSSAYKIASLSSDSFHLNMPHVSCDLLGSDHTSNSFINNHVHHLCLWTTNVFHIHGCFMLLFHCRAPPLFQRSRLPGGCDSNGTTATNLDVDCGDHGEGCVCGCWDVTVTTRRQILFEEWLEAESQLAQESL